MIRSHQIYVQLSFSCHFQNLGYLDSFCGSLIQVLCKEQIKSRAAHPQATMVNHLVPTKRNNNKIQGINLLIISLCFHPKFIFIA